MKAADEVAVLTRDSNMSSNLKRSLALASLVRSAALFAVTSFVLLTSPSMAAARCPDVPLSFQEQSELDGVPYSICVPSNWNGTLLVWARGWIDRADHPGEVDIVSQQLAPSGAASDLLANGYALAQSAFRNNGYAVEEGLQNSLALTGYFKDRVGKPTHAIFWGGSLGGLIALEAIERFPAVYDAAIALAAPSAGAPRTADYALAFLLAYHVTFGWPPSWGELGNLRDDLDFETEVFPILYAQVRDAQANPATFAKFEFIRRVSRQPQPPAFLSSSGFFFDMALLTEAFAELERRAHGPVWQNLDHVYTLPESDKADLELLGLDPDPLLAAMNAIHFPPDVSARNYVEQYADFTGHLTRPVLTVHSPYDNVIVHNESAYFATVQAAGATPFLVQAFTDRVGHAVFTKDQVLFVVQAMQGWLQTGRRPDPSTFPTTLGFLPDFQPPQWPHVQP